MVVVLHVPCGTPAEPAARVTPLAIWVNVVAKVFGGPVHKTFRVDVVK